MLARFGFRTLAQISGNGQSGFVGGSLLQPFVARVVDHDGVPAAGVATIWRVTGAPAGATGHGLLWRTEKPTDAAGLTANLLALGNLPGVYTVEVTAPGALGSPVVFTATAQTAACQQAIITDGGDDAAGRVLRGATLPLGGDIVGLRFVRWKIGRAHV